MGCGLSKIEIVALEKKQYKKPAPFTKDSKIAIIGAGAGGIHMAYELKKKGFKDITVFEKDDHVGGKAYTFKVGDKCYDTGTVFSYADPLVLDFLRDMSLSHITKPLDALNSKIFSKSGELLLRMDYAK